MRGFSIARETFDEVNVKGGVLIGFDLGLNPSPNSEIIFALRPVYRTASGTSYGREYGKFTLPPAKRGAPGKALKQVELRAKAGFAVGSIKLRTGLNMDAMALVYHKISGTTLEPTPSYQSKWVGNIRGGSERELSSRGAPVVGVFGNLNDKQDKVIALGLIHLEPTQSAEPPPLRVAEPAPVAIAPAPKQPAPLRVKEAAPPPPEPAPKPVDEPPAERFRDATHHFSFEIPVGWRAMSNAELETINNLVQQRMPVKAIRYAAGFCPRTRKTTYPYILVQTQVVEAAKMSYEDIEAALSRETAGALQEAQGVFADVLRNLVADKPVLDRERNRIALRMKLDIPAVGKVQSLSVTHIGNKSLVSLHAYARDEHFGDYVLTFAQVNDTFAFEQGFGYNPSDAEEKELIRAPSWIPIAVFAGVFGVIFLPMMLLLGRKKRQARPAPVVVKRNVSASPPSERTSEAICDRPTSERARPAMESFSLESPPFFTIHARSIWSGARLYRVYVLPDELLFLDLGVPYHHHVGAGAAVGGLIGAAVGAWRQSRAKGKQNALIAQLDTATLDDLMYLSTQGKSYRMRIVDLMSASIEAASWWDSFSNSKGNLLLDHAIQGKHKYCFQTVEEVGKAIELLQGPMGATLFVNVILDKRSWNYVRRS
jgi:hypothetical protein